MTTHYEAFEKAKEMIKQIPGVSVPPPKIEVDGRVYDLRLMFPPMCVIPSKNNIEDVDSEWYATRATKKKKKYIKIVKDLVKESSTPIRMFAVVQCHGSVERGIIFLNCLFDILLYAPAISHLAEVGWMEAVAAAVGNADDKTKSWSKKVADALGVDPLPLLDKAERWLIDNHIGGLDFGDGDGPSLTKLFSRTICVWSGDKPFYPIRDNQSITHTSMPGKLAETTKAENYIQRTCT